jgi:hypothetical protein
MSLATFPGRFIIPLDPTTPAITGNANWIQDAATEAVAMVFEAPGGLIRTVGFMVSTVTSAPTDQHTVRLETVDAATGLASGSLAGANTEGSILLNTTGFKTVTLTADASVAEGTKLAVVVTAPAANFGSIRLGSLQDIASVFPYCIITSGGKSAVLPLLLILDDSGVAMNVNTLPVSAFTANSYNSGSSPDRRGMRFQLPGPARLKGINLWIDADGDFDVVFYAADGVTPTVLASVDKDIRAGTAIGAMRIRFASPQTLAADTWYRVVILPTSVTSVGIVEMEVASAAYLDAFRGGTDFQWTEVAGAPALEADWTNVATSRLWAGLEFDQIDDGAAGSSTIHIATQAPAIITPRSVAGY